MSPEEALAAFRARAEELDANDPLASFRERFIVDETIYLDGNSLGRLPKATAARIQDVVERQWGRRLVRAWGEDWIALPKRVGAKIAPLIGVKANEVVVCDSTSVNFYKLVQAALRSGCRPVILTNSSNFPSDLYLLQGLAAEIRVVDSEEDDAIEAALDETIGLLTLSHVEFKSGFRHRLDRLTAAAHRVGARVLWDLSHSVGACPIELGDADYAVGCTYKYLNGGPGAPAFLYVREDLQESHQNPIQGWFGSGSAFKFSLEYEPAQGIGRFLAGTPPILSMASIEPGVDMVLEATLDAIWKKAATQSEFLLDIVDALGWSSTTPRNANKRGSHVAVTFGEAWRIAQALVAEHDVVPDFRAPDVLRLGIAPLYTRFVDLVDAAARILSVLEGQKYLGYPSSRDGVT